MATSKEQFRELFANAEPELLAMLDKAIEEFGRDQIKNLKVYCPTLPTGGSTRFDYRAKAANNDD